MCIRDSSCSVGREALSINRNSVLKSPMPSPPFCNTEVIADITAAAMRLSLIHS